VSNLLTKAQPDGDETTSLHSEVDFRAFHGTVRQSLCCIAQHTQLPHPPTCPALSLQDGVCKKLIQSPACGSYRPKSTQPTSCTRTPTSVNTCTAQNYGYVCHLITISTTLTDYPNRGLLPLSPYGNGPHACGDA